MEKVSFIVFTKEFNNSSFINKADNEGIHCLEAVDVRSAVYMATGISASNKVPVYVFTNSSNSSRSAFPGMTEAYYRKLPVILVTFGTHLDYTQELSDVVIQHKVFENESELPLEIDPCRTPAHFEIRRSIHNKQVNCAKIQKLLALQLNENHYLYISPSIRIVTFPYRCKIVEGGMPNCLEGSISNVLGASLSRKKDRYIGLLTEEEMVHDINSLGNRHINDLLYFIVICKDNNCHGIEDYAESLSFNVMECPEKDLTEDRVKQFIRNKGKSLLIVISEEV